MYKLGPISLSFNLSFVFHRRVIVDGPLRINGRIVSLSLVENINVLYVE